MKKITDIFKNLAVERVEEQKEERSKVFYAFYLSLTKEEETRFNRELKETINTISEEKTIDSKDKEIHALKLQIKDLARQLERSKKKSIIDRIILKIFKVNS